MTIQPPREDKRKVARRVIVEALAQAWPITAGLAHLYRFTHPTAMERALEEWRAEISSAVNDQEGRLAALEARLFPRMVISDAALALALWLTKQTEPWPPRLVAFETIAEAFPEVSKPEMEEGCAELAHLGLVKTSAVMGHPIHTVQPCPDLYWAFDPVVMGSDPTADARELARRMLVDDALTRIAKLDEAMAWPRRRLNPAVARLIPLVGPTRISREINAHYPTTIFLLIPDDRFRLRRFAEGGD